MCEFLRKRVDQGALPNLVILAEPRNPVILAEPSRTAEGGTTGFGGNPEERAVLPSFHWIPVTPVITADGCDDGGDENDGSRRGG